MKSKIRLSFMACIVVAMSLKVPASVYDTNNDPNNVKKIVMRTHYECNGGSYTYDNFCEHYLSYGESMAYYDYSSGGCTTIYSCDSCTYLPGGISSLGLTTASGWQCPLNISSNSNTVFFNYGAQNITLSAKSADGITLSSGVQWQITDIVNDVTITDWSTQSNVTLGTSSSGAAFLVKTRFLGSSVTKSAIFSFAGGSYGYGAGGNPNKIRTSTSFPYKQERVSSCVIASARNILSIKGKQVPSEDEILGVLANNGKPVSDFERTGSGSGLSDSKIATKLNIILQARNLTIVQRVNILRDDVIAKLNSGAVIMSAIYQQSNDLISGLQTNPNHVVVLKKSREKTVNGSVVVMVQVWDPSDGDTPKKELSIDEALNGYGTWNNTPPLLSSKIWEVLPYP